MCRRDELLTGPKVLEIQKLIAHGV
jgi:hypothetical protein